MRSSKRLAVSSISSYKRTSTQSDYCNDFRLSIITTTNFKIYFSTHPRSLNQGGQGKQHKGSNDVGVISGHNEARIRVVDGVNAVKNV